MKQRFIRMAPCFKLLPYAEQDKRRSTVELLHPLQRSADPLRTFSRPKVTLDHPWAVSILELTLGRLAAIDSSKRRYESAAQFLRSGKSAAGERPSTAAVADDRDAQANGVQISIKLRAPRVKRPRHPLLLLLLLLLLSPRAHYAAASYYVCLLLLARQSHDVGGGTLVEEPPRLELSSGTAKVRRRAPPRVLFSTHLQRRSASRLLAEPAGEAAGCMHASRARRARASTCPASSFHAAPFTAPGAPLPASAPSAARRSPASPSS